MARSVDQVEYVFFAVAGQVFHLDRMALDGDAFFALQVHVVQDLGLHFPLVERIGLFQQTVGQCRFAVVDMGYDAEIAYVFHRRVKSLIKLCKDNIFPEKNNGFQELSGADFLP